MNLARLSLDETARTDPECALQRAENLAVLGVKSVLELCVGPSLRVLEAAYASVGIEAWGNDVDRRWRDYYPEGRWLIGDALSVGWSTDAVVFAPPVTLGCTGRRVDSLPIDRVTPSYRDFLTRPYDGTRVLVLPARSVATSFDREQYHRLLSEIPGRVEAVPLHAERRRIRKYVDLYVSPDFTTG